MTPMKAVGVCWYLWYGHGSSVDNSLVTVVVMMMKKVVVAIATAGMVRDDSGAVMVTVVM